MSAAPAQVIQPAISEIYFLYLWHFLPVIASAVYDGYKDSLLALKNAHGLNVFSFIAHACCIKNICIQFWEGKFLGNFFTPQAVEL